MIPEDAVVLGGHHQSPGIVIHAITVVIVGDIDTGRTVDLMEEYFGSLERGPDPNAVMSEEPKQEGEIRVKMTVKVDADTWVKEPLKLKNGMEVSPFVVLKA